MGRVTLKGGTMLAPLPTAMVTCGDMEESNIITIAWTGILSTIPPKTYISVRPKRHSYEIIKKTGEFVIHLTTENLVRAADYCGMYTGAKVDKFAKCALTKIPSCNVSCPTIGEAPIAIECRVTDSIPMGSHEMFMADIVSVSVDDSLFDKEGKIHMERAHLVAFSHGEYYSLGKKLAAFGASATKKTRHR